LSLLLLRVSSYRDDLLCNLHFHRYSLRKLTPIKFTFVKTSSTNDGKRKTENQIPATSAICPACLKTIINGTRLVCKFSVTISLFNILSDFNPFLINLNLILFLFNISFAPLWPCFLCFMLWSIHEKDRILSSMR